MDTADQNSESLRMANCKHHSSAFAPIRIKPRPTPIKNVVLYHSLLYMVKALHGKKRIHVMLLI